MHSSNLLKDAHFDVDDSDDDQLSNGSAGETGQKKRFLLLFPACYFFLKSLRRIRRIFDFQYRAAGSMRLHQAYCVTRTLARQKILKKQS